MATKRECLIIYFQTAYTLDLKDLKIIVHCRLVEIKIILAAGDHAGILQARAFPSLLLSYVSCRCTQTTFPMLFFFCPKFSLKPIPVNIWKEVAWGWSQGIKDLYAQTNPMGSKCHVPLLNHGLRQTCLTWAKVKSNWTVTQWCKVLFKDETFLCLCKTRSQSLEEERRETESVLDEVQCEVSKPRDGLGCHVICSCCSTKFAVNAAD